VSRARRIVIFVLAMMFFALAVTSALQGAPWFIPPLWVVSGVVLLLLVRKTGGLGRGAKPRPADPVRRARRSGNPAVRAAAEQDDSPMPPTDRP
jgi:hypothetical protein